MVLSAAAFLLATLYLGYKNPSPNLSMIDACYVSTNGPDGISECLRALLPRLLAFFNTRDIQRYTVASTTSFTTRDRCHPIGHLLGAATYEKFKDVEKALAACSADCRDACLHGAIGAAVRAELGISYNEDALAHASKEDLLSIGSTYCAERSMCHAVGHVAYMATRSVPQALGVCDSVSTGYPRETCYHGVFMERTGFTEKLDSYAPVYTPASENPVDVGNCAQVDSQYKHACYAFYLKFKYPHSDNTESVRANALEEVTDFCSKLSQPDRAYCFEGIGLQSRIFDVALSDLENQPEVQLLCDSIPGPQDRTACSIGVVPRYLFLNKPQALRYCHRINESGRRVVCYRTVFQHLEAVDQKDDVSNRCMGLSECTKEYWDFKKEQDFIPDYRFGLFGK